MTQTILEIFSIGIHVKNETIINNLFIKQSPSISQYATPIPIF